MRASTRLAPPTSRSCVRRAGCGGGGAGRGGGSLARALRGGGGTLMGAAPRLPPLEGFAAGVSALGPANAEFLRALGVWAALPAERLTPVHSMRVYGDD